MLGDQFVAASQSQQRSGSRKLSFRKETNNFARRQLFGCGFDRGSRVAGIDWNAADGPEYRLEQWLVIKFLIDDITNPPRTGQLKDDGIDPGNVIRQKQTAAWRQVMHAVSG